MEVPARVFFTSSANSRQGSRAMRGQVPLHCEQVAEESFAPEEVGTPKQSGQTPPLLSQVLLTRLIWLLTGRS